MKKTALIFIILTGIFLQTIDAQTIRNTQNSVDSGSRSDLTVDPVTHALQLQIPLGSYPQRNGNLPVGISYSSKLWHISSPAQLQCGVPYDQSRRSTAVYADESQAGWTSTLNAPGLPFSFETYDGNGQPTTTTNSLSTKIARMTVSLPDGSRHELRQDDSTHPVNTVFSGKFYATDGSRLVYDKDTDTLYLPDGSRYLMFQGILIDRNGNQTTYGTGQVIDSLGRVITTPLSTPINTGDSGSAAEADITYAMPGIGTTPVTYYMHWRKLSTSGVISDQETTQTLKYKGDWTGTACGSHSTSTSDALFTSIDDTNQMGRGSIFDPVVLHKIDLPNGQSYTFKYNIYGEISKIIYPTGAYERFAYGDVPDLSGSYGVDTSGNPTLYGQANRGVIGRWVSADGAAQSELYYSYGNGLVTYPDGTSTGYGYYQKPGNSEVIKHGFDNPLYGKIYEERQYATDGTTLLRRKLTEWTTDGSIDSSSSPYVAYKLSNPRVTREVSIQFEPGATAALAQLSETTYDTNTDAAYFATLNPKQTKTYHYVTLDLTTAATATLATLITNNYFSGASLAAWGETDYLYDTNYKARNMTSLPVASRVKDASGNVKAKSEIAYDETTTYSLLNDGSPSQWQDPNTAYRGNVTTTKSWTDIANNQFVQTHAQYNKFGSLRKAWDAKGNLSQVEYSSTYSYAYPTKTISPIPSNGVNGSSTEFESTTSYDFNTGKPLSATDANGQTSTIEYNDALLRPTKTTAPNGHETITEYGAGTSATTRFVKVKTQIDATNWKEGYSWYDGLGRTIKSQSVDASGDVFTEIEYDTMGRAKKSTNPYRANETKVWTENTFDSLGRATKIKTPDNAEVNTAFSLGTGTTIGTIVTVTDQAGKQRRSIMNGLGQLSRVDEPNDSNSLGTIDSPTQATAYSYDTLSDLTTVTQGSQTRDFVYDSLSRLKSATNPESGLIQYTYDANGNLQTKRDARGIKTVFDYDALNRVFKRCYRVIGTGSLGATSCSTAGSETVEPNTADVSYFYDNLTNAKGQLIKVSSNVSQTEYTSFDTMGRVTASEQRTPESSTETVASTTPRTMSYGYNLSGALLTETYPSGRVVKNVIDTNGDLEIVQSKKNSTAGYWNYADHFSFTAAGAVSSMQLGNNKWESTVFNSRLQPTQIALGTVQNGTDNLKLNFDYGTTSNNGNVLSQTITVPTIDTNTAFVATQTYTYDSLNRLKSATETIPNQTGWKQTFLYDRYGNRTFDEGGISGNYATTTLTRGCTTSIYNPNGICDKKITNPKIAAGNNQIVQDQDGDSVNDYLFDTGGNTTKDAGNKTFTYDGESKQTKVMNGSTVIGEYSYDGDGKRVKKYVPSTGETTIFVYDAGGKMVAEYSTIVASSANAKVSYLTQDNLGSPRITTDANGGVISRRDFMPFGEEVARASYGTDSVRQKFTAYERDIEADLDFAQARYYKSTHGRFTSPDPYKIVAEIKYEKDEEKARAMLNRYISQPQQWNQYVYAINNPLKYTDPTGEEIWLRGTKEEVYEAYGLVMDILGGNGSGTVSEMVEMDDGSFTMKLTMSEENGKKLAARGAGTDDEMLFKGMAEMLTSTTVVEGRIDGNFINLQGKLTDVKRISAAGAATIPAGFSSTGHRQVVISPNSVDLGNRAAAQENNLDLSSDGKPLTFNKAMIFGHELGHAWDSMRRHTGDAGALGFENAMRARDKNNNRRRKAEQ